MASSSVPNQQEVCPGQSIENLSNSALAIDPTVGALPSGVSNSGKSSPCEKCAICLGFPENRCYTDSCFHEFCFVCLMEWSKVKAECPLCKQKFRNILHNIQSTGKFDEFEVAQGASTTGAGSSGSTVSTQLNSNSFGYDEHGNRFRFNSTMTAQRMELLRHIRTLQARLNELRSHEQNNHRLKKEHERIERLNHFYVRSAHRPETFTASLEFRRMIYERGLRVRPLQESQMSSSDDSVYIVSYRDTSPEFYRENPAQMHRLIRWLNRELNVFFNGRLERINFVSEFVCHLLTRYEIRSADFTRRLSVVLLQHVDHFLHEFYHFARSPLEMDDYDRRVSYDPSEANGQNSALYVLQPITVDDFDDAGASSLTTTTVLHSPPVNSSIVTNSILPLMPGPRSERPNSQVIAERLAVLRRNVQKSSARLTSLQQGIAEDSSHNQHQPMDLISIGDEEDDVSIVSDSQENERSSEGNFPEFSTTNFSSNHVTILSSGGETSSLGNNWAHSPIQAHSTSSLIDSDDPLMPNEDSSFIGPRTVVQTNSTLSAYSVESLTISTASSPDVSTVDSTASDGSSSDVLHNDDWEGTQVSPGDFGASLPLGPHSPSPTLHFSSPNDTSSSPECRPVPRSCVNRKASQSEVTDDNADDLQIIAELKPKSLRTPEVVRVESSSPSSCDDLTTSGRPLKKRLRLGEIDPQQFNEPCCSSDQSARKVKFQRLKKTRDVNLVQRRGNDGHLLASSPNPKNGGSPLRQFVRSVVVVPGSASQRSTYRRSHCSGPTAPSKEPLPGEGGTHARDMRRSTQGCDDFCPHRNDSSDDDAAFDVKNKHRKYFL